MVFATLYRARGFVGVCMCVCVSVSQRDQNTDVFLSHNSDTG